MVERLSPKEKEYKKQGDQISDAIKNSDIKTLQQLLPTAEDLVKATEYCDDRDHDIMDQIALTGNHEMLKKILNTYFSDRSEENDDLRRRFLLSHRKSNGYPKNFHYIGFSVLPPFKAMEKVILSKTEEEQFSNIQEFKRINEDFKKPTDDKNKQLDQRKMEVYITIRDAYMEVYPKTNPHLPMKNKRYGLAPKGEASNEFVGYTSTDPLKGFVVKKYDITYPMIRLVNIPENQNENEPLMCQCFEVKNAKFTEGKNDLAEQVFRQMAFPDAWTDGNYFTFLQKYGETYQKIHDDPIADAVVHNFNQNNGYHTFENRKDKTTKINIKAGNDYRGYAYRDHICLRTDYIYNEGTIFHEGGHNTDDREFNQTDLYKFVATAIYATPEKSQERKLAVNDTLQYYNCSEFEVESLARIPQQYFSSHNFENDPLLRATCDIFSAYGKAKLEKKSAVLERINHCMRLRLSGKIGYKNLSNITDMRLNYFAEKDRAKEEKPDPYTGSFAPVLSSEELKQQEQDLRQQYAVLNGNGNFVENEITKCINTELKAIEKINQHPLAEKIILDLDTISRDNITEEEPLEVLIAKTYESTKKISPLRAQKMSEQELAKETKKLISMGKETLSELKKDKDDGMLLDRALYCTAIRHTATAAMYTSFLTEKYFSKQTFNDDIQAYIPNELYGTSFTLTKLQNVQDNIQIVNNENSETRILPEMFDDPLLSMQRRINEGQYNYEDNKDLIEPQDRIENMKELFLKKDPIETMRLMQLLYKEFNPQAKSLPEDLHFASLTKEKIKNGDWQRAVNKYQDQFVKQLEKQAHNSQTQAPISKDSSHSL
ncbi:MAG: hypothetical protein J6Y53_04890 [Alphaproteobacteria bacterium]|nr:hypothetical protein [Alphaproteobacteria bacterium]